MTIDQRISAELRRHAPQVDEQIAWHRIESAVPQRRRSRAIRLVSVAVAAFGLVVVGFIVGVNSPDPDPVNDPASRFAGTWFSTEFDGSNHTAVIKVSSDGSLEFLADDDYATACSGAPSTMTGTGRLEGSDSLVIPAPVFTCDDGSEPVVAGGPPVDELLRDYTFTHDPETDTLTDSLGAIWTRDGIKPASSVIWPETSREEGEEAQKLANSGDPAFTWRLDSQLVTADPTILLREGHRIELVDRFLREVLGWEESIYIWEGWESHAWGGFTDIRFLRCAPGEANPHYPANEHAGMCAPTLDELRYETVSIDLVQPYLTGPGGIWAVGNWRRLAPFAQVDPEVARAEATSRIEEFLAARVEGRGAERYVDFDSWQHSTDDGPLLFYRTSKGSPYERFELEFVGGPRWPHGDMEFAARLFADGGETVAAHPIYWYQPYHGERGMIMAWAFSDMTENGEPVTVRLTSTDGEVSFVAPNTWSTWSGGGVDHPTGLAPGVWFWNLYRGEFGDEDRIEFTDPVAYDAWCASKGGSPLLSGTTGAAAIMQELVADPNFDTTAPVAARVGGLEALSVDLSLALGGKGCGIGIIDISRWIHTIGWEPGRRLRLYLVDLPEGMAVETMAITVVAPEGRFDEVIAETAPIIESIEFHASD